MANSISDLKPDFWAREAQRSLFVDNKAMAIAKTTLRNLLAGEGDVVNRVIVSYPNLVTYVPGTDIATQAITGSKEALTVDTYKAALVTIDDTEKVQSIIELGTNVSNKMMHMHNNNIEQAVLAEVTNALWTLDDGHVGGVSGNNAIVNTNSVPQFFTAADTKLDAIDAPKAGRTAVVGTHFLNQLKLQQAARQTTWGDGVNNRGVVNNLFGWDILYSNNLPYTAVLSMATQPTNGDTITIAGVTITLHATLIAQGTTAGGWADIRTDVDTTRTFIRDLINYNNGMGGTVAGTHGTDFTDVSPENRFLWQKRGLLAVDSASADTLTITGYGDISVSETLTDPTDGFTTKRQDALFLVRGAIDLIVQIPPKVEVTRDPDQFADIVKSMMGRGVKTFADGAREMVRVKIDASTSDWN
jgi:hypothetical protein